MRRFRLCVSLTAWFSTFSSQCFVYSLFIISVWSVRNNGTVGFILVWGLVLMCSLVCEKVERDRFQLLLSVFPLSFHFCMSTNNIMHKQKYSLSCFSWYENSWATGFHLKRLSSPVFLRFHWSDQITRSHEGSQRVSVLIWDFFDSLWRW